MSAGISHRSKVLTRIILLVVNDYGRDKQREREFLSTDVLEIPRDIATVASVLWVPHETYHKVLLSTVRRLIFGCGGRRHGQATLYQPKKRGSPGDPIDKKLPDFLCENIRPPPFASARTYGGARSAVSHFR